MGSEFLQNIHRDLGCCLFWGGGSVVVESLFIAASVICGKFEFDLCFVVRCSVSFLWFSAVLLGKRELSFNCDLTAM